MGLPSVLQWILFGLVLAGLSTSMAIGFINMPTEELETAIYNQNTTLKEKGTYFILMQLGYKSLTPAKRIDWLKGGTYGTDYYYLLEDWPLLDEIDVIGIILVLPFIWLLIRWETESWQQLLVKILIIILLIPIGLIIAKIIYFFMYYESGQALGISRESLVAIREKPLGVFESIIGPLFFVSLISFGTILHSVIGVVSGD